MKLKLLVLGVAIPAVANAATNVTLQNFSGVSAGNPIVDNTGTPIDNSLSSWAVGTFETAFADGLSGLDTVTDDQAVIDAFTQSGADGALSINGLFNGTVESDSGNANANAPLYALVTYNAAAGVQALVFDLGRAFPTQDGAGNASVDLGRLLTTDDVAFGNTNPVAADTSTLPAPFAGFNQGITFDVGGVIPEPSTGLLSLIAGLGLLARRRR
ncbi:PEP-CTERM sorting domain-containing protein [Akkermansiaceae bacterium]|nr:PEP-CTERM sorting domain-containing protein [Akkermansiaceae bacterium]MDB4576569.1 PEP-CTERM sorting domain-containing protein [Akkermansiaceae bacterium]